MCAWNSAKVEAMDRSELTKYDRYVDGLRHWIEDEKQREQNGGVAPPRPLMRGDGAYPPEYPENDPPRWDIPNRQKQAARNNAAPRAGQPQRAWKRARAKGPAARERVSEEGASQCPSAVQGGTFAGQQCEAVVLFEAEDASPASAMEGGPEPRGQRDAAPQSEQGACAYTPTLVRARG